MVRDQTQRAHAHRCPRPALGFVLMLACSFTQVPAAAASRAEPIRPIPPPGGLDVRAVALGEMLFRDPLLSRDGSIACASCHVLEQGGHDGRSRATGIGGAEGALNTPTVFNAALGFRQFWDGRAASLETQVDGPIESPMEMGSSWTEVLDRLRRSPAYVAAFGALYRDGISRDNVRRAIAEFERSLVTPGSRFDRYLEGDSGALSDAELSGYASFKAYGCVSCHQGVAVGGNMFQRMGVMGDYFADRGNVTEADYGRYNVTGDEADRYSFKVPSLRNVALTAPYFHDGSAATLEAAVEVMARYQLGRPLPREDLDAIVLFLGTLTGEYRGRAP